MKRFERALAQATESEDRLHQAIAMYGLARANANLCHIAEAEKWFLGSIEVRESIPDDEETGYLTQNLIEFARFLVANDRPEDAVPYFERSVPMLEELGIEESDPIGYAEFLDKYVATLRLLGRTADAEVYSQKAGEIRARHPGEQPEFRPRPYPSSCG